MVSLSATATLLLTIAVLSSSCMADNVLSSDQSLTPGSAIGYGSYWLTMQQDCNLVLYDDDNQIWASNTDGRSKDCLCTLQSDGNLVVSDADENVIWASNTTRDNGSYVLVLQPDRNLVIYGGAIWASGTNVIWSYTPAITTNGANGTNNTAASVLSSSYMADHVLYSDQNLTSGSALEYGSYRLTMQQDCNLVLYDDDNPIWASNTDGRSIGCRCTMQDDGNLVVYDPYGNAIWSSGTARDDDSYVLVLQFDRNLVIYGGEIWSTATNAEHASLGDTPAITASVLLSSTA